MNKLINELTSQISSASLDEVRDNYQECQELLSAFQKKLFQVGELIAQERKVLEQKRLTQLLVDAQYQEPVYPEISYEDGDAYEVDSGTNGSCVLKSEPEAKDLIARLVSQNYYYGHDFKWQGAGLYTIVPSWKYDHDGEVIYTATYKREDV